MVRPGGQVQLSQYDLYGGSTFNSVHLSRMFKDESSHEFGVQVSKMFSSSDKFDRKPLTYMTMGKGNYETIVGDTYSWTLFGDDNVSVYVTEVPNATAALVKPGFNKSQFQIILSEGYLKEPDVLLLDNNSLPMLEIVGESTQLGADRYLYTVRQQTNDDNSWIPLSEIAVGIQVRKVSTSIGDEDNGVWGTDHMSTGIKLQSQIGYFGEEFKMTDKALRRAKTGAAGSKSRSKENKALTTGVAFALKDSAGNFVDRAGFVEMGIARLINRVENDREYAMHFGQPTRTMSHNGRTIKKTGPGYRLLCRDGYEEFYNGTLTAQRLQDYFHGIFLQKVPGEQREIVVDTGEAGMIIMHNLLAAEARAYLQVDTHMTSKASYNVAGVQNPLATGGQYIEYRGLNGINVKLMYNPMKDDRQYCGRMHPVLQNFTVDSFRMDIYDFGTSDGEANMSMLVEENTEVFAYTGGLQTLQAGYIKDGSQVPNFYRGMHAIREVSGGLWIKDTSRVGALIFDPAI